VRSELRDKEEGEECLTVAKKKTKKEKKTGGEIEAKKTGGRSSWEESGEKSNWGLR